MLDTKLLEAQFRTAEVAAPTAATAAKPVDARKGPVLLLDGKRQQNAGIAFARLRMKPADIRSLVLATDINGMPLARATCALLALHYSFTAACSLESASDL